MRCNAGPGIDHHPLDAGPSHPLCTPGVPALGTPGIHARLGTPVAHARLLARSVH